MWDGVIRALPSGVEAVAPDLPGFGGRAVLSCEPSLDAMAEDLLAALSQRGVEKAAVAGMSMGGYVALALAERAPERVTGLALVDSRPQADTEEARAGRRRLIERVRAAGEEEGPTLAADGAIPRLFATGREEDFARFAREGAKKAGVSGICWALEAMARRPDRTHVMKGLVERGVPVRVVHGTEDRFVPIEDARAFARETGAELVEIPGAGHSSPIEAPERVAEALAGLE